MNQWLYRSVIKTLILLLIIIALFDSPVSAMPVSLNVVDAQVRDVLISLARLSNINLIADDSVDGKITLQIDNVDVDTALELIIKTKNLFCYKGDDVLIVTAKAAAQQSFAQLYTFKLQYIDPTIAQAAADTVLGGNQAIDLNKATTANLLDGEINAQKLSSNAVKKAENNYNSSRRLNVDLTTNTLCFFGTDNEAAIIRQLLKSIDVPGNQVSLEAKIIAIEKTAAKSLGIEWSWSELPQYPDRSHSTEAVTKRVVDADGKVAVVTERLPREAIERQAGNGVKMGGIIQFGRGPEGYPFEAYYTAKLNALLINGKANILARPNITTINGNEAIINIGGSVPVPTTAVTNSTTTTSIEYRDAGIILRYTPRVNNDGFITAAVHTEVSSPVYVADVKAYRFNKRSAHTTVRLFDGETMVIGGLIGSEESKSFSKIPLLGDLPILGRFFSSIKNSKSESEIMIFLTAHIVK